MIDFEQFLTWLDQSFLLPKKENLYQLVEKNGLSYSLKAVNLRDGSPFSIEIQNNEQQNSSTFKVLTPTMDIAADIIQDFLGNFMKLKNFKSRA